jgi:mannose-1-phosphate guanylyltransferase
MLKAVHRATCAEDKPVHLANTPSNCVALLLAGGDGRRLQELTREIAGVPIPKQYCRLLNGSSLLEATISRAQLFTWRERVCVVVNQDHLKLAKEQLRDLPESNVFVQPLNRDTGPGLVFALMRLQQANPNAIVAVFPTDHYIDNDRAFIAHVLRAANMISHLPDKIAVLGIAPDRPETGYGYILPASPMTVSRRACHVEAFTEKPSLPGARDIISRGGLWNTFVMVFKLSRMMELLYEFVPNDCEKLSKLRKSPERAAELYENLEPWNLSTQVLARIPQHLIMLKVSDVQWSDWGTRESVERTYRSLNLAPVWNMSNSVSDSLTA